jgi:hypothetical protein
MTTKTADSKGRVALGSRFAGQTVIIEETDPTEVRVILAQVVPQRELWLHKNPKAKASVLRGLAEARAGEVAKSPPDLEKDSKFVQRLED